MSFAEKVEQAYNDSFTGQWEQSATKYHTYFEVKKIQAMANINELRRSFTGYSPIWQHNRATAVDSINLRQLLGEISHDEVKELNRQAPAGVSFSRGRKEPALLIAWDMKSFYFYTLAGLSISLYGRFGRGYNNLWLIAGFLPGAVSLFVGYHRQPQLTIDNAYRYLLEKRSVSAHGELMSHCFSSAFSGNK